MLLHCFSTFVSFHKLQTCLYISKFRYIHVIKVEINKKRPRLFQLLHLLYLLNFPTPCFSKLPSFIRGLRVIERIKAPPNPVHLNACFCCKSVKESWLLRRMSIWNYQSPDIIVESENHFNTSLVLSGDSYLTIFCWSVEIKLECKQTLKKSCFEVDFE